MFTPSDWLTVLSRLSRLSSILATVRSRRQLQIFLLCTDHSHSDLSFIRAAIHRHLPGNGRLSCHARTSCNDVAARNRYTPWSFVFCRGDISQLDLLSRSSHGDDLETPRKARRADRAERSTRQRIRLSEAAQRTHDRRQSRQKRDCTV